MFFLFFLDFLYFLCTKEIKKNVLLLGEIFLLSFFFEVLYATKKNVNAS